MEYDVANTGGTRGTDTHTKNANEKRKRIAKDDSNNRTNDTYSDKMAVDSCMDGDGSIPLDIVPLLGINQA